MTPRSLLTNVVCYLVVIAGLTAVSRGQAPDPVGGVGIAFLPNADGELEVKAIMPGGPADKARLKPGGILIAVDGKDVDEMTPEQVRALISGKPGTIVKLTIETDTDVMDVLLERAVLQPPPGNAPAAPPPQQQNSVPQPGTNPPQNNQPQSNQPAGGLGGMLGGTMPGNVPGNPPQQPVANPLDSAPPSQPQQPVANPLDLAPQNQPQQPVANPLDSAPMPPAQNPGAAPAQNPLDDGAAPMPQVGAMQQRPATGFPAWMRPGVRITWYQGSASIPGMSQTAVQDDNGQWIDPATGQHYSNVDNPSTGGAGFLQFDVLQAANNFVAAAGRSWLMIDPQGGNCTVGPCTGYYGDAAALGDFWVNPAKLAAMQEQNQGGLRVHRMVYPLNGRKFNAIVISNSAGGGFSRTTYDLETGLLLVASSRSVGANQQQIGPQGQVYTGAGVTTITSTVLQDVRDLKLPWAAEPLPPFIRQGWTVQYRGGQTTAIPGTEGLNIPPNPITIAGAVDRADQSAVVMKVQSRMDSAYGAGQQSEAVRCYGSGMIGGLWINPRALAQLQPGAVVDEDRISKVRTTFGGVQNNVAVITEQGPLDAMSYFYDLQSGILVGVTTQQKSGVATITTQIQLAGQR